MYEVKNISPGQNHKYPPDIFSHSNVEHSVVKKTEQCLWNTESVKAVFRLPIDLTLCSKNAATAEDRSVEFIRNLVSEDLETQINTLEKNENQVAFFIWKIRYTSSIPDRESIAQRLFELFQYVRDEGPESTGISVDSLRSFYSFLQTYSNLKKPAIGLSPVNDVYISWKFEPNCVFSINFLASGHVDFAIIRHSTQPEQRVTVTGNCDVKMLMDQLIPRDILEWVSRGR